MRAGRRTFLPGGKIDYKQLRKINPQAARLAVIEYLRTNGHNISHAALTFGINRTVVYDIIRKEAEGNLDDRSRAPKHQPRKTPQAMEDKVVEIKNKTHPCGKALTKVISAKARAEESRKRAAGFRLQRTMRPKRC